MLCSKCGKALDSNNKFCKYCGTSVVLRTSDIICSNCGTEIEGENKFCTRCGAPIRKTDATEQIPTINCPQCSYTNTVDNKFCLKCGTLLSQASRQYSHQNIQEDKLRKKNKGLTITLSVTGAIAAMLIVALLINIIFDPFASIKSAQTLMNGFSSFEDMEFENDFSELTEATVDEKEIEKLYKQMPKVEPSGTKALKIKPIKGVVLQADKNALDKKRKFKVSKLDFEEMGGLVDSMPVTGMLPLQAIDIDSGMKEDEQFPGKLNVEMDLKKMGIPEELWEFMDVVRLEGNEDAVPMHAVLEDGKLKFSTNRNSVFVAVLLSIGFAGASGLFVNVRRNEKFGDKELYYTDMNNGYYLYWPAELQPANINEVKNQYEKLKTIAKKYGYEEKDLKSLYDNEESFFSWFKTIYSDSDFKDTLKTIKSKEWQKNNLYPEYVKKTLENIEKAHDYLFKIRGFKKPDHIDYIIRDPWPHNPSELAITQSSTSSTISYLIPAYIHLKYNKDNINWTNQLLTLTHETFHVVQDQYYFSNSLDHLFFNEATAIKIQFDANEHFKAGYKEVKDDRGHFDQADRTFAENNGNRTDVQNQGYFYSYYLDYLEKINKNLSKDEFLKKAVEDYGKSKDAKEILLNINKNRSVLFKSFFQYKAKDFFKDDFVSKIYRITDKKVIKKNIITAPFSTAMYKYSAVVQDNPKIKFVLRAEKGTIDSNENCMFLCDKQGNVKELTEPSVNDGEKYDIAIPENCTNQVKGKEKSTSAFILQEIQYSKENIPAKAYDVFAMYQQDKPEIQLKTDNLHTLEVNLHESGLAGKYVEEYLIVVKCPSGSVYKITTNKTKLDIPLQKGNGEVDSKVKDIDGVIEVQKLKKTKEDTEKLKDEFYKVKYYEITNSDSKVYGPASKINSIKMNVDISILAPRNAVYEISEGEKANHEFEAYSNYTGECYIEWDFNDDSKKVKKKGNTSTISHKYEEPGIYNPVATLYDKNDKPLSNDSITIEVKQFDEGAYEGKLDFANVVSATRDRYENGENKIKIIDYGKKFNIYFNLSYEEWEESLMIDGTTKNFHNKEVCTANFTSRASTGYDQNGSMFYEFMGECVWYRDEMEGFDLDGRTFKSEPNQKVVVQFYPDYATGDYNNVIIYKVSSSGTYTLLAEGYAKLVSQ